MHLKERVYEILEVAETEDRLSRFFDVFILGLICLNTAALVWETCYEVDVVPAFFGAFEIFSVAIFSVEYVLRLWACTESPRYSGLRGRLRFALTPLAVVDLVAVLPFYLQIGGQLVGLDLRFVRAVRMFRLFRLAKLTRYSSVLHIFARVLKKKREELLTTLSFLALLLLFAASLMYFAEAGTNDQIQSIPTAMWWAVATLTTVGYGDVYPVTPFGKAVAAIIAILGIGMFALPAGILGAAFSEEVANSEEGEPEPPRDGPSVICPHCGKAIEAHS